jgi:hypothetical protein
VRHSQIAAELFGNAIRINRFPLVEFDRKPIDKSPLRGFVLRWTDEVTLVHVVEDQTFQLNGYAIFLNADVCKWRVVTKDMFFAKASAINKLRPSRPKIVLGEMKQVLASAASVPLVVIHRERTHPGVCQIGRVLSTSQRSVVLQLVSPSGVWEEKEKFLLREITLVEFGGGYERLLARIAGKPPKLTASS